MKMRGGPDPLSIVTSSLCVTKPPENQGEDEKKYSRRTKNSKGISSKTKIFDSIKNTSGREINQHPNFSTI